MPFCDRTVKQREARVDASFMEYHTDRKRICNLRADYFNKPVSIIKIETIISKLIHSLFSKKLNPKNKFEIKNNFPEIILLKTRGIPVFPDFPERNLELGLSAKTVQSQCEFSLQSSTN